MPQSNADAVAGAMSEIVGPAHRPPQLCLATLAAATALGGVVRCGCVRIDAIPNAAEAA